MSNFPRDCCFCCCFRLPPHYPPPHKVCELFFISRAICNSERHTNVKYGLERGFFLCCTAFLQHCNISPLKTAPSTHTLLIKGLHHAPDLETSHRFAWLFILQLFVTPHCIVGRVLPYRAIKLTVFSYEGVGGFFVLFRLIIFIRIVTRGTQCGQNCR